MTRNGRTSTCAGPATRRSAQPTVSIPHPNGLTAVVEVAQVVGITDEVGMATPVGMRSTRGCRRTLVALLDRGVRRFMIGLGGSSTNDGGSGLLEALGLALVDDARTRARRRRRTDWRRSRASTRRRWTRASPQCEIRIMSDVNNPLTGALGATAIFGPQKGVPARGRRGIRRGAGRFAALAEQALGRGAASSIRARARPEAWASRSHCWAASFSSGAEVVAELIGLDAALADADWAITGEGRSDRADAAGQGAVRRRAARGGAARAGHARLRRHRSGGAGRCSTVHFAGCFGLPHGPATLADCIANAAAIAGGTGRAARPRLPGRARRAAPHCEIIAPGRMPPVRGLAVQRG